MAREYDDLLTGKFEYDRFNELCSSAFKYGEFDKIDEIIMLSMPIVNIVYYQSVQRYDDDYSAKSDLIQDALTILYRDMKLQWDKYIHVDNYYDYIKTTARNAMLTRLSRYHHYGTVVEFDPDLHGAEYTPLENLETKMVEQVLEETILELTGELLSHRMKRQNVLSTIFSSIYVDKDPQEIVSSKLRKYSVHGIGSRLLTFYKSRVEYLYQISASYHRDQLKGDTKSVKTYEQLISRIRSDEYEVLSVLYGDTPIPEIYAELGTDNMLKLIQIVGGATVKFPEPRELSDTLLGSIVYQLADGRVENLESVANIYNLPYSTIKRIFNKHLSNLQRRESSKK